jgi:signal peptidase I
MMPLSDAVFDSAHTVRCELASEVLRSSGRLRLQVMGWSMLPAVWPGDVVTVERAQCEDVSAGDIVLFTRDRRLFVHRVVAKTGRGETLRIITRGDGMSEPDPPISNFQLLGKISLITRGEKRIAPPRNIGFGWRMIGALVRRSHWCARVLVRLYEFGHRSEGHLAPCRS